MINLSDTRNGCAVVEWVPSIEDINHYNTRDTT